MWGFEDAIGLAYSFSKVRPGTKLNKLLRESSYLRLKEKWGFKRFWHTFFVPKHAIYPARRAIVQKCLVAG